MKVTNEQRKEKAVELMVDEDNDVFFEYGPCFEKIYLEQFI